MTNSSISPQLRPVYDQLTSLLQKVDALRSQFQQSHHTQESQLDEQLSTIQQEVRQIEQKYRDAEGRWVPSLPSTGASVLEGQAQLTLMLEQLHDIIYQLLTHDFQHSSTEAHQTLLQYLASLPASAQKFTQTEWESLRGHVSDAVKSLQTMVSSTDNQQSNAAQKSALGSAISKGFAYLNSYFAPAKDVSSAEVDVPVDPKLNDVEQELYCIREGLKRLRNDFLLVHKKNVGEDESTEPDDAKMTPAEREFHSSLHKKLDSFRHRLHVVEERYEKDGRFVGDDGSFAPQGQGALRLILEECYALVYEIQ